MVQQKYVRACGRKSVRTEQPRLSCEAESAAKDKNEI